MGAAPDPSAIVSQLRDTTRLFGGGTPGASPQPAPMAGGLGGMQPRPFEGNMPGQPSKTQQNGQIQPGGKSGASPQPYTALGGRTAGRSSGGKSGGAAGPYRQRM